MKIKKYFKYISLGLISTFITILIFIFGLIVYPTKKDIKKFLIDYFSSESKREVSLIPRGIPIDFKENIDKLEQDIKKVESSKLFSLDSKTYLEISTFYFNYSDLEKSYEYINKALKINSKNSKGLLLRAIINYFFGDFNSAKEDALLAISLESDTGNRIELASYFIIALVSYSEGDLNHSVKYINKSIDLLLKQNNLKGLLLFDYFLLTQIYLNLGNYDKSDYYFAEMNILKEAIKKIDEKDEFVYLILALIEIESNPELGKMYFNTFFNQEAENELDEIFKYFLKAGLSAINGDLEESIRNFEKCKEICINKKLKLFKYFCDLMLFHVLFEKDNIINWDLYDQIKNNEVKMALVEAEIYRIISQYFMEKEEYENALAPLKIALDIYTNSEAKMDKAAVFINIGMIELEIKNYFNANKSFKLALKEINEILKLNKKGTYLFKKAKENIKELKEDKINLENMLKNLSQIVSSLQEEDNSHLAKESSSYIVFSVFEGIESSFP